MRKFLGILLVLALLTACTAALAWSNADQYENAIGLLKDNQYTEAGKAFSALGSYGDSPRYAMYCSAIAAGETGLYSVAVENLKSLSGFLDSSLLATYYAGLSWEAAENYERAMEVMSGITLYRDVASRIAGYPALIKARDYRSADANEKAGKLEAALSGFKALGSYQDSAARAIAVQEKINARDYAAADAAEQQDKLETALKGFKALGAYRDSAARAAEVQKKIDERDAAAAEKALADAYAAADLAEQIQDYAAAYSGFLKLGDYRDSAARAAAVQDKGNYAQAMNYALNGKYDKAYKLFAALGDYEDSAEKAYVTGVSSFASSITDLGKGTAAFQFHKVWGIIDVTTNTTASPNWDEIGKFNQFDLARVKKDNLYGYINRQGEIVIPCEFYSVSAFDENGLCTVAVYRAGTVGRSKYYNYDLGLYNSRGQVVTKPQWRSIGESSNSKWGTTSNKVTVKTPSFSDGKIIVQNASCSRKGRRERNKFQKTAVGFDYRIIFACRPDVIAV